MNVLMQLSLEMLILLTGFLGLLVGSFLNVVIYRLPKMLEAGWQAQCQELAGKEPLAPAVTLSKPRSHCPKCQAPVQWWQNIPVFSYILLRGRCRACHARISLRYPGIELLSAVLSGLLAWHFGANALLLGSLLFTWILLVCFWIDYDHQLLPDQLTLPLLWLGLIFNIFQTVTTLQNAVVGAVIGYLFFWSVYWLFKLLTGKEGLGYGDFKLLAALGAWMGWQYLLLIVLLSGILSIMIAIVLKLCCSRDLHKAMPYGPSLVIAGWIALLWGAPIMAIYWSWVLR